MMNFNKQYKVFKNNYSNCYYQQLFNLDVSDFIAAVVPELINGNREMLDIVIDNHIEDRYTLR
jgi:hypothetical protein